MGQGRQGLSILGKAFEARSVRESGRSQAGAAQLLLAQVRPEWSCVPPRPGAFVWCLGRPFEAITRPTWSGKQKAQLVGASDIPIVRLNPGGLLDEKRKAEELLRQSGASYTIARPTGLGRA